MKRTFCKILVSVAYLPWLAHLALAQGELIPKRGVALLRNGQILQGAISREGDRYVVAWPQGGEIRLPQAQVELLCESLQDAYLVKRSRLPADGEVEPHLDLAQWCLRNDLPDCAADQLLEALAIDPDNPRLQALQRQICLAKQSAGREAAASDTPPPETAPAVMPVGKLEDLVHQMPDAAVERFAVQIQPFLINRCATSACHGIRSPSSYRLIRPPAGQNPSQRITQRNLAATFRQLHRADPQTSPLLQALSRPHGKDRVALIDGNSRWQFDRLKRWVDMCVSPAAETADPHPVANLDLAQTMDPNLRRPPVSDAPSSPPDTLPAGTPRSRDPFDPSVFNQRYFGQPDNPPQAAALHQPGRPLRRR